MNKKSRWLMLVGALGATLVPPLAAADKMAPDPGKQEYEANCIVCHGANGKGGAYVDMLRTTPPDLSTLAKRNGGVFPVARVYETVDGRTLPKGHGSSDMPCGDSVTSSRPPSTTATRPTTKSSSFAAVCWLSSTT